MIPVVEAMQIHDMLENANRNVSIINNYDYNLFLAKGEAYISFSNAVKMIRESDHIAVVKKVDDAWYVKMICPHHLHLIKKESALRKAIRKLF